MVIREVESLLGDIRIRIRIRILTLPLLLDCDRCVLSLVDTRAGRQLVHLSSSKGRAANQKGLPLPLNTGLAAHVAQTQQVTVVTDAYKDWRFEPGLDQATTYETRDAVAIPVTDVYGSLIGVLETHNKISGEMTRVTANDTFDALDEEMLWAIGVIVGGILGHVIRKEKEVRQKRHRISPT